MERDVIERRLERSRYRSVTETLERYGVPFCRLYRWRAAATPAFPPAVRVCGERESFFLLLGLVAWELSAMRRHRMTR